MRLLDIEMDRDKNLVEVADNVKPHKQVNIHALINRAKQLLEPFKDNYIFIRDEEQLLEYVKECEKNGIVSIDTETTGLDPMIDTLVGFSLYTPNKKACYVPVSHIFDNINASKEIITECLFRLSCLKVIMFNACFDIRILNKYCGVTFNIYWDCYLGAKVLKSNEEENSLKYLWDKYCSESTDDESLKFSEIFKDMSFDIVPPKIGYIYASKDAIITFQLYEYQKKQFYGEENRKMFNLYVDTELPLINVIVEMEDNGIGINKVKAKSLSIDYNGKLKTIENEFYEECLKYSAKIADFINKHPKTKLQLPISITSPPQLSILLYEVLGLKHSYKKEKPTSTNVKALDTLSHPIVDIILKYRSLFTLTSTFINAIPNMVNPTTNRLHCRFNQIGAETGRMSSKSPKQNWAVA